jgi:hypothetical protein
METEDFKNLLIDLYTTYNPDRIQDIDRMIVQYNGREFDAIKTIYIKYNFKQAPFYDPNLGTDKHVRHLIENYSDKKRILHFDYLSTDKLNKENKEIEESKIEVENPIQQEKVKTVEAFEMKCPFNIQLKFNFEEEVNVPDINNFLYVSINQRIIFNKKDGGIIGVEVKDILDNYIDGGQPIREIILDKV